MRAAVVGLSAVVLALVLSACGTDEPAAAPPTATSTATPSPSSSTTTTPAPPTTSASPSVPAPPPLSAFEGDPRVQAARAWAAAYGRAVNARSQGYQPWLATMTSRAQANRATYITPDLGTSFPGPLPFTPVKVTGSGTTSTINACLLNGGWALDPKTKRAVSARTVVAADIQVSKVGSGWKFNALYEGKSACGATKVVGRGW